MTLAELRHLHHVTLADIAAAAGVSIPYVSDLCRKRRTMSSPELIHRIARAFPDPDQIKRELYMASLMSHDGLRIHDCDAGRAESIAARVS